MKGAKEFAELIDTGQYGKLYIVSYYHARGKTFRIWILPDGENAIPNGNINPPLNKNAVEVYGIIAGHAGWTEVYDWLHKGKWIDDFNKLVVKKQKELYLKQLKDDSAKIKYESSEENRIKELLAQY